MHSINAYINGLSKKFIFRAILIFFVITAIAGMLLYMAALRVNLTGSYGQAIEEIGFYKLQIIRDGFYIYLLYAAFLMVGVVVIGWMYSRRVARPFQEIQDIAREMSKGNFDLAVVSEGDEEVHPLASAIVRMAHDSKTRNEHLRQRIEALASDVYHLEASLKNGDREEFKRAYHSLSAKAEEIEESLTEIKL